MQNKITMFDYNVDWVLKDYSLDNAGNNGYLTREEAIKFFGKLGVFGVELMHPYWHDCSTKRIKKLAFDAGLSITNYIFFVDLAMPDANSRNKAVDQVKALLDRTADLGSKLAMLIPAVVKKDATVKSQRAWMIEGLNTCAEHAKQCGITVACENLDYPPSRPLLGKAIDCFRVCKEVDHPNYRLIYDSSAPLFLHEDPLEALKIMAPYMVHVHLKSSRHVLPFEKVSRFRDSTRQRRFTGAVLDGGLVHIPAILNELKKLKYKGNLLVEYQGENDPRPALQYNVEFIKRQLSK